jgi:peptide/nickel transport system permease protein
MFAYIVRRVFYVVPIAIGVTIMVFSLVYIGPGNPIDAVLPDDASQADVEAIKEIYGFDKPLPVQYGLWLGRAAIGDLGKSIATGRPVIEELGRALGNTLLLAIAASLVVVPAALVLGTVAAYSHGRWFDKLVSSIAITGVSIPNYWLAIVLVIVFSVELNLLPVMGIGPNGPEGWQANFEHFRYMILPVIAISVIPTGIVARVMRASVAEALGQDSVQTLRAKGLSERTVLYHVIKNAMPTVMAVIGLELGNLMGGSILIETIFTWPGTGFLMNEAIFRRDLPVLQGTILVLAMFFVGLNLLVDLLQTWVDPRIRRY